MNDSTLAQLVLFHYYERRRGPFANLSDLPLAEAEQVMAALRREDRSFAAKRAADYLVVRRTLEARVREMFIVKGGRPVRHSPHYMTVGRCTWLQEWYEDGCELMIPLACFSTHHISFTYGDTFPALRVNDGRPYRAQLYTLEELPAVIAQFGLPQDWNESGQHGPERYIEAQIWEDAPLQDYL